MTTRPATLRKFTDCAMRGFSAFATFLALALMAWILYTIIREGAPALSLEFLANPSKPYGETAPLLFTALFADAWPFDYFTGPTASAPVFITNATMDSPFEEMHQMGWGAALVVAAVILAMNVAVRAIAMRRPSSRSSP
jgi:phosphate transport system permease protein